MWELNVKIIKVGTCTIDPVNVASTMYTEIKNQIGIGGGSTVTLIKEEDELLLVDTGYEIESDSSPKNVRRNWYILRTLLQLNGVKPREITKVFITHLHRDHFGCIEYFENAKWYCHHLEIAGYSGRYKDRFIPVDDGNELIPNTLVRHTPGHTRGHSSILWLGKDKAVRIAICGDAIINLAWLQSGYIWKYNADFFDIEIAKKSTIRLLEEFDIIIPGHGQPFFSVVRQNLRFDL